MVLILGLIGVLVATGLLVPDNTLNKFVLSVMPAEVAVGITDIVGVAIGVIVLVPLF